jgi:hypothetical protein
MGDGVEIHEDAFNCGCCFSELNDENFVDCHAQNNKGGGKCIKEKRLNYMYYY